MPPCLAVANVATIAIGPPNQPPPMTQGCPLTQAPWPITHQAPPPALNVRGRPVSYIPTLLVQNTLPPGSVRTPTAAVMLMSKDNANHKMMSLALHYAYPPPLYQDTMKNLNSIPESQFKQFGAIMLLTSGVVMSLIAPLYTRGMESIQQLAYILISGGLTAAKFESGDRKSISISQSSQSYTPPDPNQFPTEYLHDQPLTQPNYPTPQPNYPTEYQRYGHPNQMTQRSVYLEDSNYKGEY